MPTPRSDFISRLASAFMTFASVLARFPSLAPVGYCLLQSSVPLLYALVYRRRRLPAPPAGRACAYDPFGCRQWQARESPQDSAPSQQRPRPAPVLAQTFRPSSFKARLRATMRPRRPADDAHSQGQFNLAQQIARFHLSTTLSGSGIVRSSPHRPALPLRPRASRCRSRATAHQSHS